MSSVKPHSIFFGYPLCFKYSGYHSLSLSNGNCTTIRKALEHKCQCVKFGKRHKSIFIREHLPENRLGLNAQD